MRLFALPEEVLRLIVAFCGVNTTMPITTLVKVADMHELSVGLCVKDNNKLECYCGPRDLVRYHNMRQFKKLKGAILFDRTWRIFNSRPVFHTDLWDNGTAVEASRRTFMMSASQAHRTSSPGHRLKVRTMSSLLPPPQEIAENLASVPEARRDNEYFNWVVVADRYRWVIMALKAELYRKLIFGELVAASSYPILERQLNIWFKVLESLAEFGRLIMENMISKPIQLAIRLLQREQVVDVIAVLLIMTLFYLIFLVVWDVVTVTSNCLVKYVKRLMFGYKLAPTKRNEAENRIVDTELTPKGLVYKAIVDGEVRVLRSAMDLLVREEECALPGSTLSTSCARPVGAIMVANDVTELTLIGCFWRHNDYLITAKHVASAVSDGIAKVYLAPQKVTKRGSVVVDTTRVVNIEKEFFDVDSNSFQCETLDVFCKVLPIGSWSKLQLTKASVKKNSLYGQTISSAGWINGVLMTGGGKTVKSEDALEIGHTASTHKGFSGSPLFSGSSVVGMHVAGLKDRNVAVRIESILHFLPEESETIFFTKDYRDGYKDRGESYDVNYEHGVYLGTNKRGGIKFLTEDELIAKGMDPTDKLMRRDLPSIDFKSAKGRNWADYDSDDDLMEPFAIKGKRKNESNSTITVGDVDCEVEPDYEFIGRVGRVHCGKAPQETQETVAYLEKRETELFNLGFKKGEYEWPDINPNMEVESLQKHLKVYGDRVRKCVEPPSPGEMERCANIVVQMLEHNAFEPDIGYKTPENLIRIINSNLVDETRSAGALYQSEGMPTNADVLRQLGEQGLVDRILEDWDEDYYLKVFLKAEPNKRSKLDAGMPRIITGMPLHKMVKCQALFRNMLESSIENWKKSPVKYAFNPGNPGHPEHLKRWFLDRKINDCDKKNWDFNMFVWFFTIIQMVVVNLARQPIGMSDTEFEQFKNDAVKAIMEAAWKGKYVCTNGKIFISKYPGIMYSGWLLTIWANSVAQIILDVLIKMRMDLSDEEILSDDFRMAAGGDDTMNSFPDDFDIDKYVVNAKLLGFDLEITAHPGFDGCEFFSTTFNERSDGILAYKPVRFTKHIEKLKRVKMENLPVALASTMINYCWDDKRFSFFETMYREMRVGREDLFTLNLLKSRQLLRYRSKGMEIYD